MTISHSLCPFTWRTQLPPLDLLLDYAPRETLGATPWQKKNKCDEQPGAFCVTNRSKDENTTNKRGRLPTNKSWINIDVKVNRTME